ncbi:hypothetical protein MVEN_01510800 [Mycena venus]|uniref:Uncharacterized protein n=1 Tax=Mycena venus TaxID=2733690 RepID=A0A8H7CRG1_9AGAR|nr:hypothetical protein MVEN_01510800 [Mycena venus]
MPRETWCLIDSSSVFPSVPAEVQNSSLFIFQAASPGKEHLHYTGKQQRRTQFCLMCPCFGSSHLQPKHHRDEDIKIFYEKFGGLARNVYQRASDLDAFELEIDEVALTAVDVERCIKAHVSRLVIPENIGHQLLSAFPLTDADRQLFQNRSPSPYMTQKFLNRVDNSLDEARRRLYQICTGVKAAGCRQWVADLFDKHSHDFLLMGGVCAPSLLQTSLPEAKCGSVRLDV